MSDNIQCCQECGEVDTEIRKTQKNDFLNILET